MKRNLWNKQFEDIVIVHKKIIGIALDIFLLVEGYALYPIIFNRKIKFSTYELLLTFVGLLVAFYCVGIFFRIVYMKHKWNSSILIFMNSFIFVSLGFVMWFITDYSQASFNQTFDFKTASLYLVATPLTITFLSLIPIKIAQLVRYK